MRKKYEVRILGSSPDRDVIIGTFWFAKNAKRHRDNAVLRGRKNAVVWNVLSERIVL